MSSVVNFIKNNLLLIIISIAAIFMFSFMSNRIKNLKTERDRFEFNYSAASQDIVELETKNGNLQFNVDALTLNENELKKTQQELYDEIDNMRLKIKNLESISHTEIEYVYIKETVDTKPIIDSVLNNNVQKFHSVINDEWINVEWQSVVTRDNLSINNFKLNIKDDITTAIETETKGWWLWKRHVGVSVHISSKNPYFNLHKVEYVKLE